MSVIVCADQTHVMFDVQTKTNLKIHHSIVFDISAGCAHGAPAMKSSKLLVVTTVVVVFVVVSCVFLNHSIQLLILSDSVIKTSCIYLTSLISSSFLSCYVKPCYPSCRFWNVCRMSCNYYSVHIEVYFRCIRIYYTF